MYLKAMLRGIYSGPPADWDFRREVEEEARRVGIEALHCASGPGRSAGGGQAASERRAADHSALEVYKITGEPLSHQQMQFDEGVSADRCKVFVLGWSRGALHARIDARVDWMFAAGLVEEVRGLLERFGALGRTAAQAVGYREALAYLRGEVSLPETAAAGQGPYAPIRAAAGNLVSQSERVPADRHGRRGKPGRSGWPDCSSWGKPAVPDRSNQPLQGPAGRLES